MTRDGRRRGGFAAAALALSVFLLSACGTRGGDVAEPPERAAPAPTREQDQDAGKSAVQSMDPSAPASIEIPSIGVKGPVSKIGLRDDGRVEEPPLSRPNLAGWYSEGVTPGEIGPSVILGHVDAKKKPAIFYKLSALERGAKIRVKRKDGSTAVFKLTKLKRVDKDEFPHRQVFGASLDHAALRLVTCGGAFDPDEGHYTDNVIAYAKLTGTA